MKNQTMKKSICFLFAGLMAVSSGACANGGDDTTVQPPVRMEKAEDKLSPSGNPLFDGVSSAPYSEEEYAFTTIFVDGLEKTLPKYSKEEPTANGCVEYSIFSNIKNKN